MKGAKKTFSGSAFGVKATDMWAFQPLTFLFLSFVPFGILRVFMNILNLIRKIIRLFKSKIGLILN